MNIQKINRFWPIVSIFLLALLVTFSMLWPSISRLFVGASLLLSIGFAIYIIVHRDRMPYRQGRITRQAFLRALARDLAGLLLAMGAAMLAGGWAGRAASQALAQAGGKMWLVLLAGMAAGFAAGFGTAWLVRLWWGGCFRKKGHRVAALNAD